jgi:prepilin-type N-terminal cleavage/methylation domain-containing protein
MKTTSGTGSNRAFSLIELSVVVFIIALLVAVSVPKFVRSYNDLQLNEAARAFVTTCSMARIQAVSHRVPAVLHVSVEHQQFWLSQSLTNEDRQAQEVMLKRVELGGRVGLVRWDREMGEAVSTNAEDRARIQFLPNGTCEGGTVVFRGTEKGAGLAATVDPITGRTLVYPVKL